MSEISISILRGLTIKSIINNEEDLIFNATNGESFRMYHHQERCESVYLEDITGDLQDLIGSPILLAEESASSDPSDEVKYERLKAKEEQKEYYYEPDSETWTFYNLATIKGYVTLRWYGESNGYYSESVSFEQVGK